MKRPIPLVFGITALAALIGYISGAQAPALFPETEYVTVRWAGRENTHIIRADGSVVSAGAQLKELQRPPKADERAYCMNAILNGLARQGYELVGMHPDEYVLRRTTRP